MANRSNRNRSDNRDSERKNWRSSQNQNDDQSYSAPQQNFSQGFGREQGYGYGGDFGRDRDYNQQDFSSDRSGFGGDQGRYSRTFGERNTVGRDFMTNQPRQSNYGDMDSEYDRDFNQQRWDRNRESGYDENRFDQGRSQRDWDFSGGYRTPQSRDFNERDYSRQNRDFTERGSYSGRSYGEFGSSDFNESRPDYQGRTFSGSGDSSSSGYRSSYRPTSGYSQGYSSQAQGQWGGQQRESGSYRGEGENESFGEKVGRFFGIGPKGYKRTDDRVRDDVSERLEDHPEIDASSIEVMVKDGEVTLTGHVPARHMKRMAEDAAENVRGVKDVHNQIRVQSPTFGTAGSTGTDATSTSGKRDRDKAA